MNIEQMSEKHAKECAYSAHDKIGLYPQDQMWVFNVAKSSIRNALTELSEAFKGELQAYDGTVRELTKTVEDMQAAQSVPVVGEPVGFILIHEDGGRNLTFHDNTGELPDGWNQHKLVVQPTNAITAAELTTLREKAAMADELQEEKAKFAFKAKRLEQERDELRKDAGRYRWLRIGKNDAKATDLIEDYCDTDLDNAIDAAIAQENV